MTTTEPIHQRAGADAAFDAATLCEAFQRSAAERPDEVALRTPDDGFQLTWREYAHRVERIAAGLAALGVGPGDTVGLLLANRPEFQLIDTAVLHLGATPFSIYTSSAPDQIAYLLDDARNRVLIVERRFIDQLPEMPQVEHLVVIDGEEGDTSLADLEANADPAFDLEARWRAVAPDDVATLIYTSGTTGPPKGVEVTHANLLFVIRATDERVGLVRGGRLVSYLPHAHIVDRLVSNYFQFVTGSSVTVVGDPKEVLAALPTCRPTMFTSVPRVWSKVRAALLAGFEAEPPDRRAALEAALELGLRKARAEQAGTLDDALAREWAAADATFFRPIRERLGLDQVGWLVTGAAPMPAAVNEFFAAIGLALSDCWGMSETSGIGTINDPDVPRIGSVGRALPGTEVRLADDGELLLRGPNVMKGYRGDPQRTAEAIDADGWLRTGDVAEISDDGYVRIVDRKKELIISSGGKNMSPAQIESVIRNASPLIGQVCCIGDGRPYNVALLVLDVDGAAAYADAHGLADRTLAAVAADPGVREVIAEAVERANAQLSRVEQVKDFAILPEDWPPDGDELTPTMKLKRRPIAAKHAEVIERLYAGVGAASPTATG